MCNVVSICIHIHTHWQAHINTYIHSDIQKHQQITKPQTERKQTGQGGHWVGGGEGEKGQCQII